MVVSIVEEEEEEDEVGNNAIVAVYVRVCASSLNIWNIWNIPLKL